MFGLDEGELEVVEDGRDEGKAGYIAGMYVCGLPEGRARQPVISSLALLSIPHSLIVSYSFAPGDTYRQTHAETDAREKSICSKKDTSKRSHRRQTSKTKTSVQTIREKWTGDIHRFRTPPERKQTN